MIVRTTRHFGQTPDYWEDALTLRLHLAHERELARHPPAEELIAAYFAARGWWRPPEERASFAQPQAPQSDLPEFEP